MRPLTTRFAGALLACLLALPVTAPATDVDDVNDGARKHGEFVDGHEVVNAYPGAPGCLPTSIVPSGPGTTTTAILPIRRRPRLAGLERHVIPTGVAPARPGCPPTVLPP